MLYNVINRLLVPRFLRTNERQPVFIFLCFNFRINHPKVFRFEGANLAFAFHNNAQSGGLDASRRKSVANFLPDKSREVISNETVKYASSFLRYFKVVINFTRMLDRFFHCFLGNLVKYNSLGFFEVACFFNMPGDRFSFAVGVGRKKNLVRFFCKTR